MNNQKRRFGDRRDGYRVRNQDVMHIIMPFMMPKRTDNEAVINETIDITNINSYLSEKNSGVEFKYTFFHVICAAIAKTIYMRPKMNRFYAGGKLYDRNRISFSFVVKKQFQDSSEEALAIISVDEKDGTSPLEQIHSKVEKIVTTVRKENKTDGTTDIMNSLNKLPTFIFKIVMKLLNMLNYFGIYPKALEAEDPYFSTVFISNLGSIKMRANYHHLANWGTTSIFVIVGEKKPTPFFNADGSFAVRETLDLGITIDERIADGLYFAKSIKILKKLLENPELLEKPIDSEID